MAQKLLLANLILIAALAGMTMYLVAGWSEFEEENRPETLVVSKPVPESSPEPVSASLRRDYVDLIVVSERNLFSPERRPENPAGDEGEEDDTPPPLTKQPILHGTARVGGERTAYITTFRGRSKSGTRSEVRIGDIVQEYEVSEIEPSSMTLRWNTHEVVIDKTNAPAKVQRPSRGTRAAVNIVTIGSAAAAVETTVSSVSEELQQQGLVVSSAGQGAGGRNAGRGAGLRGGRQGQNSLGRGAAGGNNRVNSGRQQGRQPSRQTARPNRTQPPPPR